jgi:hypothetical protein
MNTEKYIKGFNNGYILAEHKPDLAESLSKTSATANDYVEGLIDGREQLEFEKSKEKISELNQLRNETRNKGLDFERW